MQPTEILSVGFLLTLMNIVVIAPSDALPLAVEEVENLIAILGNHHKCQVFQSSVSEKKLLALLKSDPVDWVWVCSHTVREGIELSDGFIWKSAAFARWLINIGAQLVILNSCFSAQLVSEIQRYADVDIVATIVTEGIEDTDATINATYLANALVRESDVQIAINLATGFGATQYQLFRKVTTMPMNEPKDIVNRIDNLEKENAAQNARFTIIEKMIADQNIRIGNTERIIKGDEDLQVDSLPKQIAKLRQDIQSVLEPKYEKGTIFISPTQILLTVLSIMLLFSITLYFFIWLLSP